MKRVCGAMVLALMLTACGGRKMYDTYVHTPETGWEKNDTLSFCVPRATESTPCEVLLGLRTTESYPFTSVSLIVEQYLCPTPDGSETDTQVLIDTLSCTLTGPDGSMTGSGVSYHQYSFPVRTINIHSGDSLTVRVRHDMKREILPGISDLGIEIVRH